MAKHVLVPVDGSKPSWAALDYAIENFADDRLTILHVVDPVEGVYTGAEGGYYDPDAFDRAVERGETFCEQAGGRVAEAIGSSATVETAVETGRPSQQIVRYAEENDVDHVVVGSRGRTGVSRILLGSVAETVVRSAPAPVTVVR